MSQMLTQSNTTCWETRLTDSDRTQFCCHINQETLHVAASFQSFALSFHTEHFSRFTVLYHRVPLDVAVTPALCEARGAISQPSARRGAVFRGEDGLSVQI